MTKKPIRINEAAKQATRIQTSLINDLERKALVAMARRMPRWVNSDMLTFFGVFGALVVMAGYTLTHYDYRWLWLASLGLVFNWFGDSLDGSLARVRHTQRPTYGFFLDHNMDGITITLMCVGAGLSPFLNLYLAMAVLVVYLLLSVYVYISAHLKGEFKLTYAKLGPTEFRLIVIVINTLFICIRPLREYVRVVSLFGTPLRLTMLDYMVGVIFVFLVVIHIASLVHDAREYAVLDPMPQPSDEQRP